MTNEEFEKVIDNNHELLDRASGRWVQSRMSPEDVTSSEHCAWMLEEALKFHTAGQTDKANRWLGYVQGVLAHKYRVPLDDLKKANTV